MSIDIRETLFGDMPLAKWPPSTPQTQTSEPWPSFLRVRQYIESGDAQGAANTLKTILNIPGLESREYLQAYCFLRELGVSPATGISKNVLGVVVEVGMKGGLDIIAGYADHRARYYNFSGAAVIWERPDARLDSAIDELLRMGNAVAGVVGVWDKARPPAPPIGRARINLLTPGGLRFGEGPLTVLGKDKQGGPVMATASVLMQELIKLTRK